MSIENPYFHRGPIRNPLHFFGRSQEITNTLSLLKNNQSVSIVGPRRMGKTSFLLHISHPELLARYGLSSEEYIFVFIDCEGLTTLGQAEFYRVILEETQDQLLDQGLQVDLSIPDVLTYRRFERSLRCLNRQGLKLIYCFDEFELMSQNHSLDADFFSGLRGLTARHNVCYVTASQEHLLELSYAEGVLGSPFFNIFAVQHLGLLSQAEALQLIHCPSQGTGVAFSDEAAEFILSLVGPHPLFLNVACFHVFAWLQKCSPAAIGAEALDTGIPRPVQRKILAELEGHLRYYWRKLDRRQQEVLASLEQTEVNDTTQVMIRQLEQQGLVVQDDQGYHYSSTALADIVSRQVAEKTASTYNAELVGCKLGPYVISEQIGEGGMARVFRGHHEALRRDVAVKILSTHLADDESFLERFRREAQAVAALRHPHIVQVHDFGLQNGLTYMVMEFVTGGTLQDRLASPDPTQIGLPLPEVVRIIREIAAALDYAHAQGIVHRDLKPANIMFTEIGQVILADFGLARLMGATYHTETGTTLGTPAYMSPEQVQGERGDERSDIYSLGVILYQLVTGCIPFDADTPFGVIMKHLNDPPPPPRSLNPHLPQAIEPIILKALAKKPDARYQTAAELAQALQALRPQGRAGASVP